MEADYLKRTIGASLAEGMAEVASKRPSDPIEYLALWLLKKKQNAIVREEFEKALASQPVPAPIITKAPQEPASDGTSGEKQEVMPPLAVKAEFERPSSTLDRIEEEQDDEMELSAGDEQEAAIKKDSITVADSTAGQEGVVEKESSTVADSTAEQEGVVGKDSNEVADSTAGQQAAVGKNSSAVADSTAEQEAVVEKDSSTVADSTAEQEAVIGKDSSTVADSTAADQEAPSLSAQEHNQTDES